MNNKRFFKKSDKKMYKMTEEVFKNPLMGFVPRADFPEAVSDNTLVYVDITLRELEPEEGYFDFDTIERKNHLKIWRMQDKHAVLRLICDLPGVEEHLDIPDWLFKKTHGDGAFYTNSYGKGYSPDYTNPLFINYHKLAVEALGSRYGSETFISFIELGSLGHWGEWHIHPTISTSVIPLQEYRLKYIMPYLKAFPKTRLLMRRPFKAAKAYRFGLYNDMIGHPQSTEIWMAWLRYGGAYDQTLEEHALVPMTEAWRYAPIGGEFTSALSIQQMLTADLQRTLNMLSESHTTFIGPHFPIEMKDESPAYRDGREKILQTIGYRIGITQAMCTRTHRSRVNVKLIWENDGVAPMYWNWPVYLYFVDPKDNIVDQIQIDLELTELYPSQKRKSSSSFDLNEKRVNTCVYVGIEDPSLKEPLVRLVSDQKRLGTLSLIKDLRVLR